MKRFKIFRHWYCGVPLRTSESARAATASSRQGDLVEREGRRARSEEGRQEAVELVVLQRDAGDASGWLRGGFPAVAFLEAILFSAASVIGFLLPPWHYLLWTRLSGRRE